MGRTTTKELPKNIRRRADGRYEARAKINGIAIDLIDTNLQNLQKSFNSAKKAAMEEKISYQTLIAKTMTLNEWFDVWTEKYDKPVSKKSTQWTHYLYYKSFVGSKIGDLQISTITERHIRHCIKNAKISPIALKKYFNFANRLFEKALQKKIIETNPCADIVLPRTTQSKTRNALSDQEIDIIKTAISGHLYEQFLLLLLETGMRKGEAIALLLDDIDFDASTISVNHNMIVCKNGVQEMSTPKSQSGIRTIPMTPEMRKILNSQLQIRQPYVDKAPAEFKQHLFLDTNGQPFNGKNITNYCKHLSAKCGVKFTPHLFRHTFASRCYLAQIDPKVTQQLLGHKNIAMTLDVYTHLDQQTTKNELMKLEACKNDRNNVESVDLKAIAIKILMNESLGQDDIRQLIFGLNSGL